MRAFLSGKSWSLLLVVVLAAPACSTGGTPMIPRVTVSPLFSPAVYDRIAVYVEDKTRRFRSKAGAIRRVEDEFMRMAMQKGYTLAARSDMEKILQELQLQRSPVTEAALARLGRALNVSAVLLVSINEVNTTRYQPAISFGSQQGYATLVSMSARLISAELAQVVWISSYTGRIRISDRREESQALVPIAFVVASGLPNRSGR